MARQLRIEYAGALHHITSRGNAREAIYQNDKDRTEFLSLLNNTCNRFNWQGKNQPSPWGNLKKSNLFRSI